MEVQAPRRELVFQALRSRCSEEIREGKLARAERTRNDLDTLQKSNGANLYEMHRNSSERLRTMGYPHISEYETGGLGNYLLWHPEIAIPGGLVGLVGASLLIGGAVSGQTTVLAVGASLTAGMVGLGVYTGVRLKEKATHRDIVSAVERNQDFIRSYQPTQASTVSIDSKVFLAGLAGQEQKLAAAGQYTQAAQMGRVHAKLSQLPGKTADELMENLLGKAQKGGDDREVLELIQGPCSKPIAESIETLMEVSKLVAPGTLNTVQEGKDSIIIGGVVLKKA